MGNNKKELEAFLDKCKLTIAAAPHKFAKETATRAIDSVTRRSPVKSGRYIKSHRVTIDGEAPAPPEKMKFGTIPQSTAVQSVMGSLLLKVSAAKQFKKITISNGLHYARNIEYLGWEKTGPYQVYHHAMNDIKASMPSVIRDIRAEINTEFNGKFPSKDIPF
ncbi:MAG: hypothetical protein DRI97_04435 [Bacteroidetes bacterium]|nr:MAG: hypothetical protein DRI97_04435 [Bacteroidota bacterium]